MSNNKHIFQVGFFTGISRALGFVRDVLIANIMGAGFLSDIFLTAFRLPNMFRDWLGEGALNVAFVPMFGEHKGKKSQAAYFASNAFSWLMLGLLFITILMLIFMPLVIMGIAPGFAATPDKTELTILISRIMFGYVLLVCGMAFLSGILNAYREFAIAAAMPALTNVFMIGGLLFAAVSVSVPVSVLFILSFAVLLSGIVQIIILWRRLKNRNFGLRLIRPRLTPKMKILFKRIGIGFIGTGFYQISMIVGIFIASFQVGAVSWLYYADRMVQLPFAMIGL
ncbi:MAG: hypothetical protein FWC83_02330, partial [Alphaproteobacteria bacterium]|nr:hypothetical protein [Alphaproteobacteria bacterium]